ncbi:transcription factor IBH1-like 1 [Cornus florida]|uniref:transcription factor IBH1-like 1 n=1 Tax=Cornus florida TaxID=4283 RepID=UPI0028A01D87|nr:transcription factor IBH1-like 1 [Cornus florida]
MRGPSSVLKQEFVKKWGRGLEKCSWTSKKEMMSILERKKAIKLSADLAMAMASARNATTCWSRAVIANASKDGNNKVLVDHILGTSSSSSTTTESHDQRRRLIKKASSIIIRSSKKVYLKRSRCSSTSSVGRAVNKRVQSAESIARRLVKKRTNVLKSLIPGGESMDGLSTLMEETLDYIVSLRTQVDVMRHLANAA